MTIELKYLLLATMLGIIHLFLSGFSGIIQHGSKYAMGPRDEQLPITGKWARLNRAYNNFLQSFVFFVAAIITANMLNIHNEYTIAGAKLYVWARIVYIPVYIFGIPVLRTLVWGISIIGIISIILGTGISDSMLGHI